MATMKDVAEKAGVSITTVSHVINETRFVSPAIRAQVLAAARETGFRRNELARSLRRKHSQTIGLVLPDATNPFFAEIARSVADALSARSYSLIVCNSDGQRGREDLSLRVLAEKQVDGIVLIEANTSAEERPDGRCYGVPYVMLDRLPNSPGCDSVHVDNAAGAHLAVRHLLEMGHRRIACIAGPSDVSPSGDRVTGFLEAMEKAELSVPERWLERGDFGPESGYDIAKRMLQTNDTPTAIFACNDLMAFGAIRAAADMGLRVPQDISVIGFDDIRLSSFFNPPLTTIAQPHQQMGALAVELLLERIADRELPNRSPVLETKLIVRASTAKARI